MSKRDDTVILKDIQEAIDRIISYATTYEEFLNDIPVLDKVLKRAGSSSGGS